MATRTTKQPAVNTIKAFLFSKNLSCMVKTRNYHLSDVVSTPEVISTTYNALINTSTGCRYFYCIFFFNLKKVF